MPDRLSGELVSTTSSAANYAGVAQWQEAIVLGTIQCQFESDLRYHLSPRSSACLERPVWAGKVVG